MTMQSLQTAERLQVHLALQKIVANILVKNIVKLSPGMQSTWHLYYLLVVLNTKLLKPNIPSQRFMEPDRNILHT